MRKVACWSLPLGGVLLAVLLGLTSGSLYEDMVLDDLYKRLSQLEDSYMMDDYGQPAWSDNIPLDSRDSGQAYIRDPEYLQHSSSNGGFQYISGGAGEGSQHLTPEGTQNNTQEVKSDESLPFYCHPPNPCPKGFTEKDGCRTDVKDEAKDQQAYIQDLMNKGRCTCDEEHMFSCPQGKGTMNMAKGHEGRDQLDRVLDSLLGGGREQFQSPYAKGSKRDSLVAKKSPGMMPVYNPYLQGDSIGTVAKKG